MSKLRFIKDIVLGDKFNLTSEFEDYLDKFEKTSNNYFLTGNAGTGKSTLITHFRKNTNKNVVVLAPTGLAANNIQGQTIHSFFRFPPKIITLEVLQGIKTRSEIYQEVETIIIDEASMVRADMLDAIDNFLRMRGRDPYLPFGGTQIILVGDLYQLPPVVTYAEKDIIGEKYDTPFFFSSQSWRDMFKTLKLNTIFRQSDEKFIKVLNKIRKGEANEEDLELINTRANISLNKKAVTLTSVNKLADQLNFNELNKLSGLKLNYEAAIEGNFDGREYNISVPINLSLKVGARVMFTKNGKKWVNGTLGVVTDLDPKNITVQLDESGEEVFVDQETWKSIRYKLNKKTGKIEEEVLWSIKQFPLRLAYAITIHKSQGMTFDKINIDYTRSPFAHGQTYVALSRSKSLSGLHLSKSLTPRDIIVDRRVVEFHEV